MERRSRIAGRSLVQVVPLALTVAACGLLGPDLVCTTEFRYGLAVRVQDSVTGTWAASGTQLVARSGSYVDSMSFPPDRPDLDSLALAGAGEHPGTYLVTIRKAGYGEWMRSGVRVTADACHVRLTTLTARIQRAP